MNHFARFACAARLHRGVPALGVALLLVMCVSRNAVATTVVSIGDDFGGTLAMNWIDRNGAGSYPNASIVVDPLNPSNRVLSFPTVLAAGALFSKNFFTTTSGSYTVSFDYLGIPNGDSSSGGFFGISLDVPAQPYRHDWMAGTALGSYPGRIQLIDDGNWHSYSITFTNQQYDNILFTNPVRLMFEDWDGAGSQANNAYFDNVRFYDSSVAAPSFSEGVPEIDPAGLGSVAALITGALGLVERRRMKAKAA